MKSISKSAINIGLLMLLAVATTGCINYDTRLVKFDYQPVANVQQADGQQITILKPDNQRKTQNPKIIGQVRDGYSIPFAQVMCESGDITLWIDDALHQEFTKAGYTVEKARNLEQASHPCIITTNINKFYIDGHRKVNAKTRITFTITYNGKTIFNKQYEGQHIIPSFDTYAQDAVHHHPAARKAIEQVMSNAVPEMISAIQNNM